MRKVFILIAFTLFLGLGETYSQELNAQVSINHQQIQGTNTAVFENLQKALTSFLNDRQWTNLQFTPTERIECTFNIILSKYSESENRFEGNLQIQANRPVYNTSYKTTEFAFQDPDFAFVFQEFDQLEFRMEQIDNNLTAIFAYYVYLILGIDMDCMSLKGGQSQLENALFIVNNAQGINEKGWKAFESNKNRYALISDYLDASFDSFRQLQYKYHRNGLDEMAQNAERGRSVISEALTLLKATKQKKSTNPWPQLFSEYKKEELVNLFKSKGTAQERESVCNLLISINPSQNMTWNKIKQ